MPWTYQLQAQIKRKKYIYITGDKVAMFPRSEDVKLWGLSTCYYILGLGIEMNERTSAKPKIVFST